MPKANLRIPIPSSPADLIALGQKIAAKHQADGASSPLTPLKMTEFLAALSTATTSHNDSEKFYRQAEKATEDRDLALGQGGVLRDKTVRYYVHSVRDLLQGLNKGNETALGTWGFDVVTSPRSGGSTAAARKSPKNTPPAA